MTINPLIPAPLKRLRQIMTNRSGNSAIEHPFTKPFAKNLTHHPRNSGQQGNSLFEYPFPSHTRNEEYRQELVQNRSARIVGEFGNPNVSFRYPWLDKRLLEYSLSIPGRCKRRDGYSRYLMRRGLDNVLPAEIQWRISRTPFSPDYLLRYNRQKEMVSEYLSEITESDPIRELIDVARVEKWINQKDGDPSGHISRELVPGAIYLIHFLRTFPEFQK